MDFKKTIFEACAAVPSMGDAIAAAYDCIFEANVGTAQASSTQVQNGGTSQNDVAIDPAAITENPESAKILADIATKASQQQQQVEQAQKQLDQTTEAAKTTLMELDKEHDAQETLNEQNQKQIPNTQG
jgi:flagellar motility protein MotE (MotC chaperone)